MTLCFPQDGRISVDYLNWRQKGMYLPPLVTTSTNANIARDQAACLATIARKFCRDERVLTGPMDGLRLNFGFWLDPCQTWGIGADMFKLDEESLTFSPPARELQAAKS